MKSPTETYTLTLSLRININLSTPFTTHSQLTDALQKGLAPGTFSISNISKKESSKKGK